MRETLPALGFCLTSQLLLRASYKVSLITAKSKAPHTDGKKLIKSIRIIEAGVSLFRYSFNLIGLIPTTHFCEAAMSTLVNIKTA